jgi:hypothetical protein
MGWASAKWWESNPCLEKYENILGKTESLEAHHGTSTWWPIFLLFTCNELANQVLDPLGKKSNNDVLTWKAQRRTSKSKLRLEGALKSLKNSTKMADFSAPWTHFCLGFPGNGPVQGTMGPASSPKPSKACEFCDSKSTSPEGNYFGKHCIYIHILYIIFYIYITCYIYIHTHISDHKWMF